MIPGVFIVKACRMLNARRLSFSAYKGSARNRLKRQSLRANKHKKVDKMKEKGEKLYKPGGF